MKQFFRRRLPNAGAPTIGATIDVGTGGEPTKKTDIKLSTTDGEVVDIKPFSSKSPATQARTYIRFLHTGESLGVIGQTLVHASLVLTLK